MSNSTNPTSVEVSKRLSEFSEVIGLDFDTVTKVFRDSLGVDAQNEPNISLEVLDNEEFLTFGDLAKYFNGDRGVPLPKLRLAIRKLRPKTSNVSDESNTKTPISAVDKLAESVQAMVTSHRTRSEWTDRELLESLSREEVDIAKILFDRSHGRRFVVFTRRTDSIDVDSSLEMLKIAKRQATDEYWEINGVSVRLYRAGDFPSLVFEESPLVPGVALADGYCMKSKTNWTNIDRPSRVFVRLCVMDDPKMSKRDQRSLFNLAKKGFNALKEEYPEIALQYDELDEVDNLPKLTVNSSSVDIKSQSSTRIDRGY